MVEKKGVWKISGPSSTVCKCYAVLTGKWLQTFRRNVLFHFTGSVSPRTVS